MSRNGKGGIGNIGEFTAGRRTVPNCAMCAERTKNSERNGMLCAPTLDDSCQQARQKRSVALSVSAVEFLASVHQQIQFTKE
jgi:hypothetical protein